MEIDFENNTIQDGYGSWNIIEKNNDCYIAKGFGNINTNQSAYQIGFRDQHVSVMRLLPHHFYDLSMSIIEIIKQLPDDKSIPEKLRNYKKKLL